MLFFRLIFCAFVVSFATSAQAYEFSVETADGFEVTVRLSEGAETERPQYVRIFEFRTKEISDQVCKKDCRSLPSRAELEKKIRNEAKKLGLSVKKISPKEIKNQKPRPALRGAFSFLLLILKFYKN
ncbi:MAG: hypothetical protein QG653_471 [Patescibacteria group bacterium]|nr:hypothetical protein [Patescibacteria group bacterium]